jgi:hypothetical protein
MTRPWVFIVVLSACSTWTQTGSVYRSECLHVGIRPADLSVDDEVDDWGITLQVTTEWGPCLRDAGD